MPTTLDALRRDIDRIDNALHDLLMERAALAEKVSAAKALTAPPPHPDDLPPSLLRPAREMSILKRLLGRHHGPFPKASVVRLWREIIAAMLSLEAPLTVAVLRDAASLEIARDHYGAYTPTLPLDNAEAVIEAVRIGVATVGILPLPGTAERWWQSLAAIREGRPSVVSRVPVLGPGEGRGGGVEALSIARIPPEATGDDYTLLVVEGDLPASLRESLLLESEGLESEGHKRHLYQFPGFIAAHDPRVSDPRFTVLGSYADPKSLKVLL